MTYEAYSTAILAGRPPAVVVSAVGVEGLEAEIVRAEQEAWEKTGAYKNARLQNGRMLPTPPEWREHRPRVLAELQGHAPKKGRP